MDVEPEFLQCESGGGVEEVFELGDKREVVVVQHFSNCCAERVVDKTAFQL